MHEWQACKLTIRACVLSCFSGVCPFATVWTVASQAPLSIGFSRQEYLSGLPCLPPGNLPDPVIKPASLALAGGLFTTEPQVKLNGGIGRVEIMWSDCKK